MSKPHSVKYMNRKCRIGCDIRFYTINITLTYRRVHLDYETTKISQFYKLRSWSDCNCLPILNLAVILRNIFFTILLFLYKYLMPDNMDNLSCFKYMKIVFHQCISFNFYTPQKVGFTSPCLTEWFIYQKYLYK